MEEYDFTIEELKEMLREKEQKEAEKQKAEAVAKAKKLAEEKDQRKKEIEECEEKLHKLINAYVKDYGIYTVTRSYNPNDWWYTNLTPGLWF